MKNILEELNRFQMVEEIMSKLRVRLVEMIQYKDQREKKLKKMNNVSMTYRRHQVYQLKCNRSPRGRRERKGKEMYLKK